MSDGGPGRALVTVSVMLATIMQALDMTIANVALPHMQGSLAATQEEISWVLTSYIVAAAIMTPPTGFLAARFGRRNYFLIAVAGFTVASMLCGIAQDLDEMVLCRLLQGMFGAALVPLSQATLLDAYPRESHGSAMALWGVGVMVGPILGPTLGGYLTEYYSWRWVFFINLPFGLLALLGIWASVTESQHRMVRRFDVFGFALLSLAIGALQIMLDRGELKDWFQSREIIVEAVVCGVAFYMFLAHSATARHPFLEPRMFADRNFTAGLFFIFVLGIILLATLALLPPFLESIQDYPVVTTGLVLAPRGIGTMAAMLVVGRLIRKIDARLLAGAGLLFLSYSLWEMADFNAAVPIWRIVESGLVQGVGLGLLFVPLSTLAFATLEPQYRTDGTSLFSLMRNIGSSVGISVVTALLTHNTQANHAEIAARITPYNPLFQMPHLPWNPAQPLGAAMLNAEITRQAATIGYLNDFRLMMYVTLVSLPMLLLLRRPPGAEREPIVVE